MRLRQVKAPRKPPATPMPVYRICRKAYRIVNGGATMEDKVSGDRKTSRSQQLSFGSYVFKSKWTWISLAATVLLWMYALAIEDTTNTPIHPVSDALVPGVLRYRFVYDLFINMGTAVLVSRIVAAFVGYEETSVRDAYFDRYLTKQEEFYDNRIREVAQSSFRGVYQSRFPDGLINEVLAVGFSSKVIRENFNLNYKLRRAPNGANGMIVEASAEYRIVNISTEVTTIPIKLWMPNPINPEMKQYCNIIEYRSDYEAQDISALIPKFKTDRDGTDAVICVDFGSFNLNHGEGRHIVLVYSMAKEVEDTELVRTGTPTNGIRITIHDETGENFWIGTTSIHRCQLRDISPPNDRRVKEFRSSEFYLPQQGFAWFWKKTPPSSV